MKTLQIQTTIRPNRQKLVQFMGTLAEMWTKGNTPDPHDIVFYLDVWAEDFTIGRPHESYPKRIGCADVYVRFSACLQETRIMLYDHHGRLCNDETFDDDTPIAIMGCGCDVEQPTRVIRDIRDDIPAPQGQEAARV